MVLHGLSRVSAPFPVHQLMLWLLGSLCLSLVFNTPPHLFWAGVSLCCSGWPRTPASVSQIAGTVDPCHCTQLFLSDSCESLTKAIDCPTIMNTGLFPYIFANNLKRFRGTTLLIWHLLKTNKQSPPHLCVNSQAFHGHLGQWRCTWSFHIILWQPGCVAYGKRSNLSEHQFPHIYIVFLT